MTPPFKHYPLVLRILLIGSMFIFNMGVSSGIALYLSNTIFGIQDITNVAGGKFATTGGLNAFLFIQGLSSLGGFLLTAMMFAVLESGEFKKHLGLIRRPSLRMVLLALMSVVAAQFFVELLVNVNKLVAIPPQLQFLQQAHERNKELTEAIMNFSDIGHLLYTTIVIALVPALGEEFFFRGLIMGDLLRGKLHPAIAIVASGLLFAIAHFEVYNVLAIWVMGCFLGYLYYVSGSLWLPVVAHFTNNFLAVLLKYFYNNGLISEEVANAETPLYLSLGGMAVFVGFVFIFNKWKTPVSFVEPEQPADTTGTY